MIEVGASTEKMRDLSEPKGCQNAECRKNTIDGYRHGVLDGIVDS